MAPRLDPAVVAAIETAVECNEGALESAYIHSLAKIYKTSPQAIVYNMKRYNKVKAGCDDRQKTGRHAIMDKDRAAEAVKEMLEEEPRMRHEKIAERLFERFAVPVSTTWVLRLMQRYGIVKMKQSEMPKPPPQRIRRPKPPKPPPANPSYVPQLPLPPADASEGQYPSFRQDLLQAVQETAVPAASTSPATVNPPVISSPVSSSNDQQTNVLFGVLKPAANKFAPAPPPPMSVGQYTYASPYHYPPAIYPPQSRYGPPPPTYPYPPLQQRAPPNPPPPPKPKPADTVWKVLKVKELP